MFKIKLSLVEYDYLQTMRTLDDQHRKIVSLGMKDNDHYLLKMSEDQANDIRDLCGEQLQLVGFDDDYEPTKEGVILESLIDKFFTG